MHFPKTVYANNYKEEKKRRKIKIKMVFNFFNAIQNYIFYAHYSLNVSLYQKSLSIVVFWLISVYNIK